MLLGAMSSSSATQMDLSAAASCADVDVGIVFFAGLDVEPLPQDGTCSSCPTKPVRDAVTTASCKKLCACCLCIYQCTFSSLGSCRLGCLSSRYVGSQTKIRLVCSIIVRSFGYVWSQTKALSSACKGCLLCAQCVCMSDRGNYRELTYTFPPICMHIAVIASRLTHVTANTAPS